jgi:signal transduction histidine kinase
LDAKQKKETLSSPEGYTRSCCVSQHTSIFIINHFGEKFSADDNDILQRFGKVFEQTYTRFLDLKKAEAQAREAQIEVALERTRTHSMLMQHSNELDITSRVFHEQLLLLGIDSELSYVWLPDVEKDKHLFWATWNEEQNGSNILQSKSATYDLDRTEPYTAECFNAWEGGEPVHVYPVAPAEVKHYFDTWSEIMGDAKKLKPEFFPEGLDYVESFMKYGCFGIIIRRLLTEDEKKILLRFTIEFERTYTRFLDLQKAEAQANEAQIETALERVRSRTLAMHKSGELAETAAVVFKQLINLGIAPNRLYIAIIKGDSGDMEFWITDEAGSKVSKQFTGNTSRNPSIQKMYDGWKDQKKSLTIDMQGKELADYFHYLSEELNVPFKQGLLQKRRVQNIAYFSRGYIGIASPDPQPEETINLLERFASVFNLTYTRFNDLQHAEQQTHKAQIEVALERVRARALAMQEPEELIEVAQVLRHEMGLLGVEELETSTIFIFDKSSQKAECWFAIKDTKQDEKNLVADHISLYLNATWVGREMLAFYNTNDKQISIPMKSVNRKEWIEYCYKLSPTLDGFYSDNIPDRTYHLYKFSNGAIGAASPGDISDESWELLQRAASVFSLAYSRFQDLTQARTDLMQLKEEKKRSEDALIELKATQSQLIQSEKMASLGELTAGIAHEIQNPLNFVNNFSEVSAELLNEMNEEVDKGNMDEVKAISKDVIDNLEKILHHGKRADGIVKGMLQHSRNSSGQKEPTDINALTDEYLRLAYHGLRAKDKSFNAILKTDYDETIGSINIIPQDIGIVILNLINNAFYAVMEKKKSPHPLKGGIEYEPVVTVTTKRLSSPPAGGDGGIELKVRDNGNGIPQKVLDKIFQPFFTTKPTGQGTGLGLSLAYDIVKAHGGELKVETEEGEDSTFIISLPFNTN